MNDENEKNWFQRNWLWALPTGCASIVACCLLFLVLIFVLVGTFIRNSDVYSQSMAILNDNQQAVSILGEPIESGFFITGNLSVENNNGVEEGFADLNIPVSGPGGEGDLIIVAVKRNGNWSYDQFELNADSGETINLK